MRYRILEDIGGTRKFVVVLDAGEEVVETLSHFAETLGVGAASVSGIGALSRSQLAWFNPATKEFRQNDIDEQTEVLAINGNVAISEGEGEGDAHGHAHSHARTTADGRHVALHVHIVLGCRDGTARGGHLVAGWVAPTMELIVEEAAAHLTRGVDDVTGLILLEPRHPCPHSLGLSQREAAE